jgi:DNA-binding GntR family transcriptional regulator
MSFNVRPVGGRSTVDDVATEIRRAYVSGALAPGEDFSMSDLSSQLDVSHIPVREALRRLEAQGLVTLRPARRGFVAPLTAKEIEEVYRLWTLICNDAVVRACVRYTHEDIDLVEAALDAFTSLPQDTEEAFEGHHMFHLQLLAPGLSNWDARLLEILWLPIERGVRMAFQSVAGPNRRKDPQKQSYDEHKPLLDAARARNVDRLQRELRAHHEDHMQLVMDALAVPSTD